MNFSGNIRSRILLAATIMVLSASCDGGYKKKTQNRNTTQVVSKASQPVAVPQEAPPVTDCTAAETLIYSGHGLSSYTEDIMRGTGVVSITLEPNNRLDIYDLDDVTYGFLVYNQNGTFYTLNMPTKVVARAVVPEPDFAQFDFDAEPENSDKDYLIIYVNKEKRMVKKADVKYTFYSWPEYVKTQEIRPKDCNLLPAAGADKNMLYQVVDLKGDKLKIRSFKGCSGEEEGFRQVEGWLKWKNGDVLTVELTSCN
jgi:hypothetical protein